MKISVIGAGNVGSLTALRLAQDNVGEIVLVDVVKGIAQGKVCDLEDARHIIKVNYTLTGTDDIAEIHNSDIVVIAAGLARKPGMTREELLQKNALIIKDISLRIQKLAPQAVVIVVTNPLDLLTYYVQKITGFPTQRVFGMGISLDASRFANVIAGELGVPVTDIEPVVVGSHGEGMMPLSRLTTVKGVSLDELVSNTKAGELVQRTINRGAEIVSFLGSGSAYFAPSAAAAAVAKAVANDEKRSIGVCAYANGEYGIQDTYIGMPCRIGRHGVEQVIELMLNKQEKAQLLACAKSLHGLSAQLCA